MNKLIITSNLAMHKPEIGFTWLVIGPNCWAKDPDLIKALKHAESMRPGYSEGTFNAWRLPSGRATDVGWDGSWSVTATTPEESEMIRRNRKMVAVTRVASKEWTLRAKKAAKDRESQ